MSDRATRRKKRDRIIFRWTIFWLIIFVALSLVLGFFIIKSFQTSAFPGENDYLAVQGTVTARNTNTTIANATIILSSDNMHTVKVYSNESGHYEAILQYPHNYLSCLVMGGEHFFDLRTSDEEFPLTYPNDNITVEVDYYLPDDIDVYGWFIRDFGLPENIELVSLGENIIEQKNNQINT